MRLQLDLRPALEPLSGRSTTNSHLHHKVVRPDSKTGRETYSLDVWPEQCCGCTGKQLPGLVWKSTAHTYCLPGLLEQNRVPALKGVQRSFNADSSMGANHYKKPECWTIVSDQLWEEIRRHLPPDFSFFHLIGESYQVVPDDYYHSRKREILK